jgi:hypothetical protein
VLQELVGSWVSGQQAWLQAVAGHAVVRGTDDAAGRNRQAFSPGATGSPHAYRLSSRHYCLLDIFDFWSVKVGNFRKKPLVVETVPQL